MKRLLNLVLLLFLCSLCHAQNSNTISFSCADYLIAYRYNSLGQLIDSSVACPYTNKCKKTFLFSIYEDDSVSFDYVFANGLPAIHAEEIYYTPPNGLDGLIDSSGVGNLGPRSLSPGDLEVGTYRLVMRLHAGGVGMYDALVGIITVIPRINKVWIDAPAICLSDFIAANQDYHFYIRTDPALDTTIFPTPSAQYDDPQSSSTTNPNCINISTYQYNFGPTIHFPWDNINIFFHEQISGMSTVSSQQLPLPSNYQEYTISYTDMLNYFSTIPDYLPLDITVNFNDGVTQKTITAPLLINSDTFLLPTDGFRSAPFHLDTLTVTGNETWTPENNPVATLYGNDQSMFRLERSLRIMPGASLTIEDMELQMGPNAKIYVKANAGTNDYGGKLTLNNTTITGYRECGNEDSLWHGIVVEGNASKTQGTITPNANGANRYQGTLILNNSTLSYAANAVRLASDDPADWMMNRGGGVVIADNSTFYNNRRSVEFMKYLYTSNTTPAYLAPNASKFTKCHFEVDNNFTSANLFSYFITGWGVRGVQVQGCSFENDGYSGNPDNLKGIHGIDLGVIVGSHWANNVQTPSTFENLDYAVEDKMVAFPVGLHVQQSQFENNIRAVTSTGMMAPVVKDNTISNGTHGYFRTSGVTINTGSGYKVTGNTITDGSIGVYVGSTGSDPNKVERNSFADLGVGGLSNYLNRGNASQPPYYGLQLLCNTHDVVDFDIAARGNNPATDGMAPDQGSAALPAGNAFYSSSTANIYNPTAQVGGINYYYNTNTPPSYSGNVSPIYTNQPNLCEDEGSIGNPSYPTSPNGVYAKIAALLSTADEEGANKDSLYYWVERWESPYGMLLKTDLLLEDGEISDAEEVYDDITSEYELDQVEVDEFALYGRTLLDLRIALMTQEKSLLQLSVGQVDTLEDIAENANLWAKVRAQNWLSLYDGREFELEILYPESERPAKQEEYTAAIALSNANSIYPNPVSDYLQVYYSSDNDVVISMELYDLMGRKLGTVLLKKGVNEVNVKGLSNGIYYYKLYEGVDVKLQGKLIKQ